MKHERKKSRNGSILNWFLYIAKDSNFLIDSPRRKIILLHKFDFAAQVNLRMFKMNLTI